jgi:hypothetical protein
MSSDMKTFIVTIEFRTGSREHVLTREARDEVELAHVIKKEFDCATITDFVEV